MDEIRLDKKAFKALSSERRVAVLKSLGRRRKMLVELSNELGMSPSTMKEHMDSLVGAGLVAKIDDGHKWKYYELTRAGRNVVNPGETRIWVIIGISAVALLFTSYGFLGGFQQASAVQKSGTYESTVGALTTPAAAPRAAESLPAAMDVSVYAAGFIVFSLILGMSVGYVWGKRRTLACLG
jgi:DNA-binding transcriptional ArsR family regulator